MSTRYHPGRQGLLALCGILSAFCTQVNVRRLSDDSGLSPDSDVRACCGAVGPSVDIYKILKARQGQQGTPERVPKPNEIRKPLMKAIVDHPLNPTICDKLQRMPEFLQHARENSSAIIHTTERTPSQVEVIREELKEHYYVFTGKDVLNGHSTAQLVPHTLGATTQLVLPNTQGVATIATLTGNIITVTLHLHHRSADPAMLDTILSQIRTLPEAQEATHVVFGGDMNFGIPSTHTQNVPNLTGDTQYGVYLTSIGTQLMFVSSGQVNTGNPFRGWDNHPFAIALLHPSSYTVSFGCMIRETGRPMKTNVELFGGTIPEEEELTAAKVCDPHFYSSYAGVYHESIFERGSDHTSIVQTYATAMFGLGPLMKNTQTLSQVVRDGLCGSSAASPPLLPVDESE